MYMTFVPNQTCTSSFNFVCFVVSRGEKQQYRRPTRSNQLNLIHCNLVIMLMMGAKRKERYSETSIITKQAFHQQAIAQTAPVHHYISYRMLYSAYYFSSSAPAKSLYLGLAEPLNYGLSMPLEWPRKVGVVRHFVAAASSAAAVSGQASRGLIVDRWDAKRHPAASQLCRLQETLHEPHHYPASPSKVSWHLNNI